MSRMNILIAPTLDNSLTDTLWRVRGEGPGAAPHRAELSEGQTVSEYKVEDLSIANGSVFLAPFKMLFNEKSSGIDLSLKAPVRGMYYSGAFGSGMFGNSGTGNFPYSLATAEKNNRAPKSLDEAKGSAGIKPSAFIAITSESPSMSGAQLHRNFFQGLKDNRRLISTWLRNNPNFQETHAGVNLMDNFWESVFFEEERLAKVKCPVLPYDGQSLG